MLSLIHISITQVGDLQGAGIACPPTLRAAIEAHALATVVGDPWLCAADRAAGPDSDGFADAVETYTEWGLSFGLSASLRKMLELHMGIAVAEGATPFAIDSLEIE